MGEKDERSSVEFPEKMITACSEWLGPDGIDAFRAYKEEHGTVSPVVQIPMYDEDELKEGKTQRYLPHPVHFREGMQVRNWMRKRSETEGWTDHDYDDRWAELVEKAIEREG